MRILDNQPVKSARKSSKKSSSKASKPVFSLGLADRLPQSAGVMATTAPLAVSDISSLMAVQGVDVEAEKAGAIKQGHAILDTLDALKLDVLSGQVSRQKMIHLTSMVAKDRAVIADPVLVNLLDHIELRARVELAKFDKHHR